MFTQSDIFLLPLLSVAKILLLASGGAYLVHKKHLDSSKQKDLSKLIQNFFLPTLIFAQFVQLNLQTIWSSIPYVLITSFMIWHGLKLGELSSRHYIKNDKYHYMTIQCCGFTHSNNIQLILVQSLALVLDQINIVTGREYPDNSESRGIIYIMIATVVNTVVRWSVGSSLLAEEIKNDKAMQKKEIEMYLLSDHDWKEYEQDDYSFIMEPKENPVMKYINPFWEAFMEIFNAPLAAILISFAICLVPPVQNLFINPDSFIYLTVTKTAEACGKVCSPMMMILLGANVANSNYAGSDIPKDVLMKMVATKMILLPATGFIVVWILSLLKIATDPTMFFVLLVTYAAPTANMTLLVYAQYDEKIKSLSTIMFFQYLVFIVTLPIILVIFFSYYLS